MESGQQKSSRSISEFQMPLHYPKYTRKQYMDMPEWMLDRLLSDYGLPLNGDVAQKRQFVIGTFLWPVSKNYHANGFDVFLRKKNE